MDAAKLFADGEAYEQLMGRWSRRVGAQFLNWLSAPPKLQWLDVGCGNGAFTEVLIDQGAPAKVVGVDPAEGQLAYARSRQRTQVAEFQFGSASALPFADDAFDVAVMALVISFVPDPAAAVAEMKRVVRPGGRVATYMWDFFGGGMPTNPLYVAREQMGLTSPVFPGTNASRMEVMQGLWTSGGLEDVEASVIRIPVEYRDFEDFWATNSAPVGPMGKTVSEMSGDLREQLKDRLRALLPREPDGRIAYEGFANAVKGRVPKS